VEVEVEVEVEVVTFPSASSLKISRKLGEPADITMCVLEHDRSRRSYQYTAATTSGGDTRPRRHL
jgi:hypothetical protein